MVKRKRLKQAENDFDVDAASHRFAVRSASGTHSPVLHCGDGLFLQAESRPLENARLDHAPVCGDDHVQQHAALIFGLARFVGIVRVRAVDATGLADAIHAGAEHSATGPAAFSWSKTAPGTAANPAAVSCPNRSEEHTSELQSRLHLVCRLLLEKK